MLAASNALADVGPDFRYLDEIETPNPTIYMPLPPDTLSIATNGDFERWTWGKAMRNTDRGARANDDSKYGVVRMCELYSSVLGIDLGENSTPAIYQLMLRAGETGAGGVSALKHKFFRKRPFMLMNEHPWGRYDKRDELIKNSSYPSSHTACGWGVALVLAEIAPHLQDTILRLGFDYGISRVIVGAHWMSDVNAAMLCASAAITRAHLSADFISDMAAARQEYLQLTGLDESQLTAGSPPSALKILDPPPTTESLFHCDDLIPYWQAKLERNTQRAAQAIADASLADDDVIGGFAASTGVDISSNALPQVVRLLKIVKSTLSEQAATMKTMWSRTRPYVHMGDTTLIPGDEERYRNVSSYPSAHAMVGWGIALALTEVMPAVQNLALKRGYEYGRSRVIAGYNYPTDVQAGQVMAACMLTMMRNDQRFNSLLEAAKQEFASWSAQHPLLNSHNSHTTAIIPSLPTDTLAPNFASDIYQWMQGKLMRGTELGQQAKLDSQCGTNRLRQIYSGILGLDINEANSPAISQLIQGAAQAAQACTQPTSDAHKRKRPFALMNEQPWGVNDDAASTMAPGEHAATAWAAAIVMAQLAPQLQDTIMVRALQCARSGVITGTCWASDVDAALPCASAAVAKWCSTGNYAALAAQARNEYLQLSGLTPSHIQHHMPAITNILGPPASTGDISFMGDLVTHWLSKPLRDTERGALAEADASIADDYLINMANQCSPSVTINDTETPSITKLIRMVKMLLTFYASSLKTEVDRPRPYRLLGERIPYTGEAIDHYTESSYPSRHALVSWGLAHVLSQVMPDCHDALFERAYTYGDSRFITGLCFASDVMAGRVMADCALVKINNETLYKNFVADAKREYHLKRYPGDVDGDKRITSADVTALYNYLINNDDSAIVNGDQDGDSHITAGDVTVVYNLMLR